MHHVPMKTSVGVFLPTRNKIIAPSVFYNSCDIALTGMQNHVSVKCMQPILTQKGTRSLNKKVVSGEKVCTPNIWVINRYRSVFLIFNFVDCDMLYHVLTAHSAF